MPSFNQPQPACNKTKAVLSFLCLFDGLRNPSIRRLVRKPRTVIQRPLLTFDPTYYAPQTKHVVQDVYRAAIQCPCEMIVDPSAQNVLAMLRKHASSMPPQRILIHYFGHGCHPPTEDGSLYFFSDDRSRYKPIKVITILATCPCPLCVIIDAPGAACLTKHFASKSDSFIFFACAASEMLPMSTDAPLDLFSSCLLTPYETALWFHRRHHSNVIEQEGCATQKSPHIIQKFLETILEAILFDSQSQSVFDKFHLDPSVFTITRGFVLAQRIYNSFNLHPSTFPELKNMSNHDLWGMWDTALDCFLTMPLERSLSTVFNLFSKSFANFPTTDTLPIFSFFMNTDFHRDAEKILLNYIDKTENAASTLARTSIPDIIAMSERPSATALVIVAKTISVEKVTPFENYSSLTFTQSRDPGVLKAGFLDVCLSMSLSNLNSFSKLMTVCVDKANVCCPYSALLMGMLLNRASRLMQIPEWFSSFSPLVKSRKSDVRASICFLMSNAREREAIDLVRNMMDDTNAVVRCQSVWSMAKLLISNDEIEKSEYIEKLRDMKNDEDQYVRESVDVVLLCLESQNEEYQLPEDTILIQRLTCNVNALGFMQRFESDAFLCDPNANNKNNC